ncbi:BZIP transcription factor family protein [Wuchereria bancrofti]|uniref:BZIP transcription factor family protein n=1 Tax=Wuchereria bancrofti TaxID=6293 RepID=J9FK80_WUCBA|nr:BZIP transcription factor family protein [Wuchereria bancrofti]
MEMLEMIENDFLASDFVVFRVLTSSSDILKVVLNGVDDVVIKLHFCYPFFREENTTLPQPCTHTGACDPYANIYDLAFQIFYFWSTFRYQEKKGHFIGAHYQLNMPQAYQTRAGFVGNTMARPASATGKRGGRRPKEYEEYDHVTLSEEERDKRDKRRLRNKEAAARCRQRRLDLMGSLQNQVNQLKEENKMKDAKIAELQLLKNELIAVIRDHHCVLPEALRQTLDVDMSSTQQYMPRGAPAPVVTVPTSTEIVPYTPSAPSPQPVLSNRKRPASAMIPDLRQPPPQPGVSPLTTTVTLNRNDNHTNILTMTKPSSMQIKQEPTLFDVNGRDLPDEEIKRPTSLTFADGTTTTTAYSSLSSSGVPITTPSNLIGGATSDFGGVNLLDGPTGLTPCHPPQATAFQLPSMTAPLSEGRSFETL